jgi:hypothetical protein
MSIARSILCLLLFCTSLVASHPLAALTVIDVDQAHHLDRVVGASSAFIETVRRATEPFLDVRNVPSAYGPVLGCVSGPEQGAMGVHFVNPTLLQDATLVPSQPEALIYEFKGGTARLVGVEFIVFAELWHETHALNDPPLVEGQLLHFVDSPNRFGLPAHYELHVWAWEANPNGAFVDWNPRVSCEG